MKARWFVAVIVATVLVWIAVDLYGPRTSDMRSFDPQAVARLETAMWRSYYDRERLRLFVQLAELLRIQYHLPFLRSYVVAYQAATAAFVFKEGRQHVDYEKALPNLVKFYAGIHRVSNVPFDVDRAARFELEWWIVHRERELHVRGDLERALADLPAEVYRVPSSRLREHGRLRAEAMIMRDTRAEAGGVTGEDWARIEQLLRESWQSLWTAVNFAF